MNYYKYLNEAGDVISLSTEEPGNISISQRGDKVQISQEEYEELIDLL